MPVFPNIPLSEVSPISIHDPWLESTHQKHLYQTRPRHIRPKRAYELEWKGLSADKKNVIERFIRSQRGPVLSFQWTYPFAQNIVMVSNTEPVTVETEFHHNILDLDKVTITGVLGNTAANGTHRAKYINGTTFELH
jgi:phage-related protein